MDTAQKSLFDNKYGVSTTDATSIRRSIQATPFTVDTIKVVDLFHKLNLKKSLVLDIGCGITPQCYLLAPDSTCNIIGLDFSQSGLKISQDLTRLLNYKGTFTPVQGDALHLPFRSATFDAVMCSMVLEHLGDPCQAIGEAARVLKTDGKLFLVTVNRKYTLRSIYKSIFFQSYDEFFGHSDERLLTMEQLKMWSARHGLLIEEELYFYHFESVIWDVFIVPKLIRLGAADNKVVIQLLRAMKILVAKLAIVDKVFRRTRNSSCLALMVKKVS